MITQGKWKIDGGIENTNEKGDLYIWPDDDFLGGHGIATVHGEIQEGSIDNARLIAAAPELLAALEQLQEAFVHIPDDMKGNKHRSGIIKHCENMRIALNVARYAVAKAEE